MIGRTNAGGSAGALEQVTATASKVLNGFKIVNSLGEVETGTMPNNGTVSTDIITKTQEVTVAEGCHSGSGKVKISTTEQAKIIAGNIKSGVTILGQTGSLLEGGYASGDISDSVYLDSYAHGTQTITLVTGLTFTPDMYMLKNASASTEPALYLDSRSGCSLSKYVYDGAINDHSDGTWRTDTTDGSVPVFNLSNGTLTMTFVLHKTTSGFELVYYRMHWYVGKRG